MRGGKTRGGRDERRDGHGQERRGGNMLILIWWREVLFTLTINTNTAVVSGTITRAIPHSNYSLWCLPSPCVCPVLVCAQSLCVPSPCVCPVLVCAQSLCVPSPCVPSPCVCPVLVCPVLVCAHNGRHNSQPIDTNDISIITLTAAVVLLVTCH